MARSDGTIIADILAGDREAYRELVLRYQDRLFGVLLRMTADRELAEDAAQDAFVKAYLALPRFRGEAAFGTWLVQIGIHAVRDRVRRQHRREVHELAAAQAGGPEVLIQMPTADPDALGRIVGEEDRDHLLRALADLPAEYRQVLVLKHLEGWSFEEISRQDGATVGALKVRAHRARRLLQRALERLGWTPDGAVGPRPRTSEDHP